MDLLRKFELGGAAQRLTQNLGFIAQLGLMVDVLVVTSTAAAEIRTSWLDSLRRRSQDFIELDANESGAGFNHCGFDLLAGNYELHEGSLAAAMRISRQSRQAVAAIDQFFDLQCQRQYQFKQKNSNRGLTRMNTDRSRSKQIQPRIARRAQIASSDNKDSVKIREIRGLDFFDQYELSSS